MGKFNKGYHCWLTNISKTIICLDDIGYTLQPRQTLDVLDDRHSNLTLEIVEASINKGSIGASLNKTIFMRKSAPTKDAFKGKIEISKVSFPYKQRMIVEVEEPNYEELYIGISDEEYANDNAEIAGAESEIHLAESKKYKEED